MREMISVDVIQAILEKSFNAMLAENEKANDPASKAYTRGYLSAINDFTKNLKTFLDTDHSGSEIELTIAVTSPFRESEAK